VGEARTEAELGEEESPVAAPQHEPECAPARQRVRRTGKPVPSPAAHAAGADDGEYARRTEPRDHRRERDEQHEKECPGHDAEDATAARRVAADPIRADHRESRDAEDKRRAEHRAQVLERMVKAHRGSIEGITQRVRAEVAPVSEHPVQSHAERHSRRKTHRESEGW